MNRIALRAVATACPHWCDGQHEFDDQQHRLHHSPSRALNFRPAFDVAGNTEQVQVRLERFDQPDHSEVGVVVGAMLTGDTILGGLYPDYPLTVDAAELLAHMLLGAVKQARTEGGAR